MTAEAGKGQGRPTLLEQCASVLNQTPNLRRDLRVATPGELAEKLAFGVGRRAVALGAEHPEITPRLLEIDRCIREGDLDAVMGIGEEVYRTTHPDATDTLSGQVFASLFPAPASA